MLRSIRSGPACAATAAASRITSGSEPKSWIETGPSSGCTRSISSTVRRLRCAIAKLETISETASPAPWRCACRRTNQLPIPASGASRTRFGSSTSAIVKGDVRGGWTAARRSALGARAPGERRAATASGDQTFRSQISRSPVSVSRSSTSSIVSQNGTIACGEAAGRDQRRLARRAPPRSGARSRRSARRSRRSPRTGSPRASTCRSRSRARRARSARSARRARSAPSSEISTPGAIAPPRYSPSAETASKLIPVPKSTTTQAPPKALVSGDRVDQPVGADLVRVVDPDRHPGLHPGADAAASGHRSSARSSPRTGRRAAARPRRRRSRRPRRSRSRSAPAGRRPARRSRRRSAPDTVRKRQCSASSAPRKAPRWVWVLPTSIASSMGRLCATPPNRKRNGGFGGYVPAWKPSST